MKIALYNLTTTTKSGGIETFNWEMARSLSRKGNEVHLFAGETTNAQGIEGVPLHTYPYRRREQFPNLGSRFRKFAERLSFGLNAYRDLVKGRYDLIYVSKPYDIPVALLASRSSRGKVIFGSGGTEFFPGYRRLVKKLDHFCACSAFNAGEIEAHCGVRPQVLPNGVNTDLFRPLPPSLRLREELGIRDGERVLVTACRLVGWKGVQYAVRAVAALVEKGVAVRYFVIGAGDYRETLEALVVELRLQEHVTFLGQKKNAELPEYYSIADLALFPSIANETFGIAIAEAMACRVPVVSTTIGGIPEVVPKEGGVLVPPRQHAAIAEAVEGLLQDHEALEKMGGAAARWVVENFAWDVIVTKFEAICGGRQGRV